VLTHFIVSSDIDRSPVLLQNDGLHSSDTALTFIEITEMMEELARWADVAQNLPTMRDTPLSCSQRAATGMPRNPGITHAPGSPQLVRAGACTAGAGVPAALGWVCVAR